MTKICLFGSLAESARAHEQTLSHFWPPTYAADGTCNCKSCPLYSASDSIKEGLKLCSLGRIFLPDPDDALIEHMLDACHRLSHLLQCNSVCFQGSQIHSILRSKQIRPLDTSMFWYSM